DAVQKTGERIRNLDEPYDLPGDDRLGPSLIGSFATEWAAKQKGWRTAKSGPEGAAEHEALKLIESIMRPVSPSEVTQVPSGNIPVPRVLIGHTTSGQKSIAPEEIGGVYEGENGEQVDLQVLAQRIAETMGKTKLTFEDLSDGTVQKAMQLTDSERAAVNDMRISLFIHPEWKLDDPDNPSWNTRSIDVAAWKDDKSGVEVTLTRTVRLDEVFTGWDHKGARKKTDRYDSLNARVRYSEQNAGLRVDGMKAGDRLLVKPLDRNIDLSNGEILADERGFICRRVGENGSVTLDLEEINVLFRNARRTVPLSAMGLGKSDAIGDIGHELDSQVLIAVYRDPDGPGKKPVIEIARQVLDLPASGGRTVTQNYNF
ncbi:MAG: hypothetical protein V3T05_07010, partial [Myxococcota bacterium]